MSNSHRDTQIEQALQALQAGDPSAAYGLCQSILKNDDKDAEAWSILGMCLAGSQKEQSLQALQRAVQLEPSEPRWYIHLGLGYSYAGAHQKAEPALRTAAELSGYAPDAVLPWSECLLSLGGADQAVTALRRALETHSLPQLQTQLSKALGAGGDYLGAVTAREAAFAGGEIPRDDTLDIINMHVMLGQYDQAQNYVDGLLPKEPHAPDITLLAANLMRWRGELGQAHDLLSAAYAVNDKDATLLLALLDLNKDVDERYIEQAKIYAEQGQQSLSARRGLAFVLARRADKAKHYDEAWHYGQLANSFYDDGIVSDVAAYRAQLALGLKLYAQIPAQDIAEDSEHIYVIGPPRSGGSLLQTILAAHPNLVSVGERGALMGWLLPILSQSGSVEQALESWNHVAADLPLADTAGMSRSYPGAQGRVFVDKMPHHAHVAGLLGKLHPRSKFIDVRRDPYDIAMSIFLHDFPDKFGYSRSVTDIAEYLKFQRRAVTAWQEAGLDIAVHNHGDFLDNPKAQGEKLFAKLGLEWNGRYLDPESRQSTVRTFSALQVRSKVTKAYSGRGQNYIQFMGNAIDILDSIVSA